MSGFNLPPGVSSDMIPGNRQADLHEEELLGALHEVWADGWSEEDVVKAWREVCREHVS